MKRNRIGIGDFERYYFRKRAARIYALTAGLVVGMLFSFAFVAELDTENLIYAADSSVAPLAHIVASVMAIVALLLPFVMIPKEAEQEKLLSETEDYCFYFRLQGVAVKSVRYVVGAVIFLESCAELVVTLAGVNEIGVTFAAAILRAIFGFALSLYFLPEIAEISEKFGGRIHVYCGIAGVMWFFLTVIMLYMRKDVVLGSGFVKMEYIVLLACMLALVYDISMRTNIASIRARLGFMGAAFILAFGFNSGKLVMMLYGKTLSFSSVAISITQFMLAVYFGSQLLLYSEDFK